ncbi:hypothetical protein D2E26_0813 [Bifidobacterium dolichotidis]|uniref:Uncharacterized protein n=1 Tax=Bifidobacterium dolichotidis TaxID=2306976 RepID=A0A430FPJ9_9BIFI|nr:hypothetical protein [Bifidobacterium dolichotidis]RSX54759.1 hypothetical protein D2E26_0813 [Bifidobacterium dolichotidis]
MRRSYAWTAVTAVLTMLCCTATLPTQATALNDTTSSPVTDGPPVTEGEFRKDPYGCGRKILKASAKRVITEAQSEEGYPIRICIAMEPAFTWEAEYNFTSYFWHFDAGAILSSKQVIETTTLEVFLEAPIKFEGDIDDVGQWFMQDTPSSTPKRQMAGDLFYINMNQEVFESPSIYNYLNPQDYSFGLPKDYEYWRLRAGKRGQSGSIVDLKHATAHAQLRIVKKTKKLDPEPYFYESTVSME